MVHVSIHLPFIIFSSQSAIVRLRRPSSAPPNQEQREIYSLVYCISIAYTYRHTKWQPIKPGRYIARLSQPTLSAQKERRQNALRMQRVLQNIRPTIQFESAFTDTFGRTAIPMRRLHQVIHAACSPPEASSRAHRREATPM